MHILVLSRFNTIQKHALGGRTTRRLNARRFDNRWMRDRLKLMEHFTAPSVYGQTDGNFSWYVFVQSGTPEFVYARIEGMGGRVICADTNDVDAAQKLVRNRSGLIATMNLDTDDAIAYNFLERFRAEAKPKNETLAFLRGMRYRTIPPWAAATKSLTNPFNIRVETNADKAETVFAFAHGKPDRIIDFPQPMWLQVVHGDNIDNIRLNRTRKDKNMASDVSHLFSIKPLPYYGR